MLIALGRKSLALKILCKIINHNRGIKQKKNCRKTSKFFRRLLQRDSIYDCDINTVPKCVCSYVSRWENYRWQRINFGWMKTHALLFYEEADFPEHMRKSRRITPINLQSNIILQSITGTGCKLEI